MKYIEDYVILFSSSALHIGKFDEKIAYSLANQCYENRAFTSKQSDVAIRLLKKYRNQFIKLGYNDLERLIEMPVFKHALRVVSYEKAVTVDKVDKRFLIKFPFNQELVNKFRELNQTTKLTKAAWDNDIKQWTLSLNETSLQFIMNDLIPIGFEVQEDIKEFIVQYDRITNDFEKYIPMLIKSNNLYQFKNIKTDFVSDDLLTSLVESVKLGVYVSDDVVSTEISELTYTMPMAKLFIKSDKQRFFIDSKKYQHSDVLGFINHFNTLTAVFLDDSATVDNLEIWVNSLQDIGVPLEQIGVYFRRKNELGGVEFNNYIKSLKLNKEVDNPDVKWIFLGSKYPKSLIKNNKVADICVMENRYVSTHHSIINVMKNSMLTLNYNEHPISGDNIVKL
jgi:hypothetical protein